MPLPEPRPPGKEAGDQRCIPSPLPLFRPQSPRWPSLSAPFAKHALGTYDLLEAVLGDVGTVESGVLSLPLQSLLSMMGGAGGGRGKVLQTTSSYYSCSSGRGLGCYRGGRERAGAGCRTPRLVEMQVRSKLPGEPDLLMCKALTPMPRTERVLHERQPFTFKTNLKSRTHRRLRSRV